MKVLILHTLAPPNAYPGRWQYEFDLEYAVEGIVEVLPEAIPLGIRGEPQEIIDAVATHRPDVIFNLCEAPLGQSRLEPHAAALFEWLGVPFTGSGSEALALCRTKGRAKSVLRAAGVPVPRSNTFPCIVKPAEEDGSVGICADSICEDEAEMERAIARLAGPVVVEEFLAGREFNVSLWGQHRPEYVSLGETMFQGGVRLLTYQAKWDLDGYEYANTPLAYNHQIDPCLFGQVRSVAEQAWRVTGLRGYATVDVRLNADGIPCVLDVNPNPAIEPGVRIHRAAEEAGWTWKQFVERQIEWAL